jgi:hypothetical protein
MMTKLTRLKNSVISTVSRIRRRLDMMHFPVQAVRVTGIAQ